MFLYHITKKKYLNSILLNGLKINSNKNGFVSRSYIKTYYIKYNMQPIFLTNDYIFIIKTQLTDNFIKSCALLKVDCSGMNIEDEYNYLNENWELFYKSKDSMVNDINKNIGKSFICKENIKPNNIIHINYFK